MDVEVVVKQLEEVIVVAGSRDEGEVEDCCEALV